MYKLNLILVLLFSFHMVNAQEGFPQKPQDNSEAEGKRYEKQKTEWVKKHQDDYINMGGQLIKKTDVIKDETGEKPLEIKRESATDTPKLSETERAQLDKAKEEWIKHNPEEYVRMGGTLPTTESKDTETTETPSSPDTAPIAEVPTPQAEAPMGKIYQRSEIPSSAKLWKLQRVEIIENGVVDSELSEVQSQFIASISKSVLRIYKNDNDIFVQHGGGTFRKFSITSLEQNKMVSQEQACDGCESMDFSVIQFDDKNIIFEHLVKMDNHSPFTTRYSFVK